MTGRRIYLKGAVKTYSVSLNGCDDYTMFDMELTDTEAHFLGRVADLSKQHSEYGCQPELTITQKGTVK